MALSGFSLALLWLLERRSAKRLELDMNTKVLHISEELLDMQTQMVIGTIRYASQNSIALGKRAVIPILNL